MSLIPISIGPFAAVYVGDYTLNDVLSNVTAITTGPSERYEGYETIFVPGLNVYLQIGPLIASIPVSFYGDDILVKNLVLGRSVHNTDVNTPPENNFYTLLLLSADPTDESSILFTNCRTKRDLRTVASKTAPGVTTVEFTAEDRSRYEDVVTYGTGAELSALLAGRSPIS